MLNALVKLLTDVLDQAGDLALFALALLRGVPRRAGRGTYLGIFYSVGVRSVLVVAITGLFIGMVLAVEAYRQFQELGFATRIGAIVDVSVVRQLGPVLAGVMLAGRVGSAMAAELATMRTTEQVDALACLGVDPVQHLGVPRLLACVLLIPLLTLVADFVGIMGGAWVALWVFHVEPHFYWQNARGSVEIWDVATSLVKATAFGGAIAIFSCHRGLNSTGGAEGVGRAATGAFVTSFVAILVLNFFLALLLGRAYDVLWPNAKGMF
jgi:phospholipid/cholesterol/gamma-HCH transport system permease protein